MVRRPAQAGLILLLAAMLLGGMVFPAQAHARLVRSDPPDNAVLAAAPEQVQLWFSESITPELSGARLLDLNGREVAGTRILSDPAQPGWMGVELPPLGEGVYSLSWKVFSGVDGHYNQGVLVFGIGAGADVSAAQGGAEGEAPSLGEATARWVNYLGLAGLTGALGVWLLARRSGDPAARRRLAGWAAICAGAAWLAGWGLLGGQLQAASSIGALLGTRWGGLWLAHQGILLGAVGGALWLRRTESRAALVSLIVLALGALAAQALNSHAAGTEFSALASAVDGLHLLSIGLWAGGVLALAALAVRPRLLKAGLVRRFTPLAVLYVGGTLASGLFSSAQQVASLDALFFTPYGQILLVKVGLVLLVGLLGLKNMRIAEQSTDKEFFWRWIAVEGGLMAAVLALTGLLTASAPANTIEYRLAGVQQPELLSQQVDDLLISFSARPNRPGQNIFTVRANSTLRPAPGEIQRVILRLRYLEQDLGEVTVEAAAAGEPGKFQAGESAFSLPGRWQVEVLVRRKGLLDSTASFTWVVYPQGDLPPVRVAAFPLGWLALPGALLVLAGAGWGLKKKLTADKRE